MDVYDDKIFRQISMTGVASTANKFEITACAPKKKTHTHATTSCFIWWNVLHFY